MFTHVSRDFKGQMSCMFAVLMSMVPPHKLRHWKKKRPQEKFATIIIKFMPKFTNGLISTSTILAELQPNGIPKSVRTFSWTSRKRAKSSKSKWPNAIVKIAIFFWLIDLSVVHVLSVDMKTQEVTNAISAKSFSTTQLKWRIIIALSAKRLLSLKTLSISSLICQKFKKT